MCVPGMVSPWLGVWTDRQSACGSPAVLSGEGGHSRSVGRRVTAARCESRLGGGDGDSRRGDSVQGDGDHWEGGMTVPGGDEDHWERGDSVPRVTGTTGRG